MNSRGNNRSNTRKNADILPEIRQPSFSIIGNGMNDTQQKEPIDLKLVQDYQLKQQKKVKFENKEMP